jgi:hypothetical protein
LNAIPDELKEELIHIKKKTNNFSVPHFVDAYKENFNELYDIVIASNPDAIKKKKVVPQPLIIKKNNS